MPEYIEREAALRHKRKMSSADFGGEFWDEAVLCEDIYKIPTADVEKVRHGEWVPYFNEYRGSVTSYKCSLCGRTESRKEPYCNCGAKMDGGK